jgi:hypothetical protein
MKTFEFVNQEPSALTYIGYLRVEKKKAIRKLLVKVNGSVFIGARSITVEERICRCENLNKHNEK